MKTRKPINNFEIALREIMKKKSLTKAYLIISNSLAKKYKNNHKFNKRLKKLLKAYDLIENEVNNNVVGMS